MEGGASDADISTARAEVHCGTTPSLDPDPCAIIAAGLSVIDRTLEAPGGGFVGQARKGNGSAGQEGHIAGHAARIYELGPEPAADDIDGRSPAVVTWYDADLFFLVASDAMSSDELVRIAISLYGQRRIKRAAGSD
jgi:hypothetical protein